MEWGESGFTEPAAVVAEIQVLDGGVVAKVDLTWLLTALSLRNIGATDADISIPGYGKFWCLGLCDKNKGSKQRQTKQFGPFHGQ